MVRIFCSKFYRRTHYAKLEIVHVNQSPNHFHNPLLMQGKLLNQDKLPLFMYQYFENVIGVEGDFHCGMHAILKLGGGFVKFHSITHIDFRQS